METPDPKMAFLFAWWYALLAEKWRRRKARGEQEMRSLSFTRICIALRLDRHWSFFDSMALLGKSQASPSSFFFWIKTLGHISDVYMYIIYVYYIYVWERERETDRQTTYDNCKKYPYQSFIHKECPYQFLMWKSTNVKVIFFVCVCVCVYTIW